jgi:hypothetical protein
MPTIQGLVIGGDFNTNHDQAMFAAERTLDSLADVGYENGFEGLPLSQRVTHPERKNRVASKHLTFTRS